MQEPIETDLLSSPGEFVSVDRKRHGNEYVGIQDDFHLRPRALTTASPISACLWPAVLASRRALTIRSSNSRRDGGEITFRMTTFPSRTKSRAFERELIRDRSKEGREKAIARGVKFSAKPKLNQKKIVDLTRDFKAPGCSKTEIAEHYGISRSSGYRLYAEIRQQSV
jgi:hypothetical protein